MITAASLLVLLMIQLKKFTERMKKKRRDDIKVENSSLKFFLGLVFLMFPSFMYEADWKSTGKMSLILSKRIFHANQVRLLSRRKYAFSFKSVLFVLCFSCMQFTVNGTIGSPSSQPSRQPIAHPSSQPARQPSIQPLVQPTLQPFSHPSNQPTRQPSSQPRGQPTSQPSIQPSRQPSCQPSMQPSRQPVSGPSTHPSSQPNFRPSGLILL
jgi:hypothetical protein